MADLHCFTNDVDTVIATGIEDALEVMREEVYGGDPAYDPDHDAWGPCDDSEEITIHCDSDGDPTEPGSDDDAGAITRTAAEWAKRGRGFLCTSEW